MVYIINPPRNLLTSIDIYWHLLTIIKEILWLPCAKYDSCAAGNRTLFHVCELSLLRWTPGRQWSLGSGESFRSQPLGEDLVSAHVPSVCFFPRVRQQNKCQQLRTWQPTTYDPRSTITIINLWMRSDEDFIDDFEHDFTKFHVCAYIVQYQFIYRICWSILATSNLQFCTGQSGNDVDSKGMSLLSLGSG